MSKICGKYAEDMWEWAKYAAGESGKPTEYALIMRKICETCALPKKSEMCAEYAEDAPNISSAYPLHRPCYRTKMAI